MLYPFRCTVPHHTLLGRAQKVRRPARGIQHHPRGRTHHRYRSPALQGQNPNLFFAATCITTHPLLHPDTIRPLDFSRVLKAVHRAGYDSPERIQRLGDAYVERCAGLVHRSRPFSDRHSHRHASCGTFCRSCVGAWVDVAPQMLALVDTIPPPYSPEDTQHLAHETTSAHE